MSRWAGPGVPGLGLKDLVVPGLGVKDLVSAAGSYKDIVVCGWELKGLVRKCKLILTLFLALFPRARLRLRTLHSLLKHVKTW